MREHVCRSSKKSDVPLIGVGVVGHRQSGERVRDHTPELPERTLWRHPRTLAQPSVGIDFGLAGALRQDVVVRDSALGARIVPANKASWDDLEAILAGASCHGGRCYCQRFKLGWNAWPGDALDRAHMLREQSDCGHPSRPRQAALSPISMASRPGGAMRSRALLTRISVVCLGGSEQRTEPTPASGPCRASSPAQASVAAA